MKVGRDVGQRRLVGDRPQTVANPVRRGHVDDRRLLVRRRHQPAGRAAAVVHQEDRLQVTLDGAHQGESVGDGSGHRVLVREHDPVFGRAEPQRAEQATLHVALRLFLVDVESRVLVRPQSPVRAPTREGSSRPLVAGLAVAVAREREAHHVARVSGLQLRAQRLVDDVVRRRQNLLERHAGFVIAKGPERREDQAIRARNALPCRLVGHAAIVGKHPRPARRGCMSNPTGTLAGPVPRRARR
jgi:hypothetical protein